jgi:hypothetical protein
MGAWAMNTKEQYQRIFEKELKNSYPALDDFERNAGYAIDKVWLDSAGFVLNCPIKVNPPNWQHGRVIYSALRAYIDNSGARPTDDMVMLDIGTAKGFSACVIAKALTDAGNEWSSVRINTVDVIGPGERVRRNTVAECDGLKTLNEIMSPFVPRSARMGMYACGSHRLLAAMVDEGKRVPFAFIDGKHTYDVVKGEISAIERMQKTGDIIVFDDCQIESVAKAVNECSHTYALETVDIGVRKYVIGGKR